MSSPLRSIAAWGRLSADAHRVTAWSDPAQLATTVHTATRDAPGLAHGMGRSYGDVALNPGGALWLTTGLDHLLAWDEAQGRLVCEAGVLLRDIQRLLLPRGWLLPVTPGTQLITVGGAIANDVHGKNHHRLGSFGDHVRRLTLVRSTGETLICGPDRLSDWFAATVGGLGLTGVITQVELQLRRVDGPWLQVESQPYGDLAEFFTLADAAEADWEHTVSWIDCATRARGRGIFMRANPCNPDKQDVPALPQARRLGMPGVPPFSLVNRWTLPPFNWAYYHAQALKAGAGRVVHVEPFSYPLDHIQNWNRMYGPRGFYQYQCVVPRAVGQDAIAALLQAISASGQGSFLAVLKTFGDRPAPGSLSFPQHGVTLALDFPNQGADTLRLFERLDAIVREARGRLYPAKDARMPRELFRAGYPAWAEFSRYRDPALRSGLSQRLLDD